MNRAWLLALVLIGLSFALFSSAASSGDAFVGVVSVIDGDTLEMHGTRIRLFGIDAPESRQECLRLDKTKWRCGQEAALALSNRVGRGVVQCESKSRDRYGRTIATCFDNGGDLNRWMVLNGWAVAYRKYSTKYALDEDKARKEARGIWAGQFEMPWDYRSR
ncbi:MAG: thermonuclease family protein [Pirellulaceae bacterium]